MGLLKELFEIPVRGPNGLIGDAVRAPVGKAEVALIRKAQAAGGQGLMVCWPVPADLARTLAVPGGEPPEHLHCTLAYCGKVQDLSDDMVSKVLTVVANLTKPAAPMTGVLGGIGRFFGSATSDGQDVCVLLVDVPGLSSFREALVEALTAAGVPVSMAHGYTPHITLQYLAAGAPLPARAIPRDPITIDRVAVAVGNQPILTMVFGQAGETKGYPEFNPDQPRDESGQWSGAGGRASRVGTDPDEDERFETGEAAAAAYADLIDRVRQPDGGFTVSMASGEEPQAGYAVSPYQGRERILEKGKVTLRALATYVKQNLDLLREPGRFLGAWNDPASGKVYLDISVVTDTEAEAARLAKEHKQLAYFDLRRGASVALAGAKSHGILARVRRSANGQARPDPHGPVHRGSGPPGDAPDRAGAHGRRDRGGPGRPGRRRHAGAHVPVTRGYPEFDPEQPRADDGEEYPRRGRGRDRRVAGLWLGRLAQDGPAGGPATHQGGPGMSTIPGVSQSGDKIEIDLAAYDAGRRHWLAPADPHGPVTRGYPEFDPGQARDESGRWTSGGGSGGVATDAAPGPVPEAGNPVEVRTLAIAALNKRSDEWIQANVTAESPWSRRKLKEYVTWVNEQPEVGPLKQMLRDTKGDLHPAIEIGHNPDSPIPRADKPVTYLLGWDQGGSTPIHDHVGSEVAVLVTDGVLSEDFYVTEGRKVDLMETVGEHSGAMQITREVYAPSVLTVPAPYIHRMYNADRDYTISIHAYYPPLTAMGYYDFKPSAEVQGGRRTGDLTSTGQWAEETQPMKGVVIGHLIRRPAHLPVTRGYPEFDPEQPRDNSGRWSPGGAGANDVGQAEMFTPDERGKPKADYTRLNATPESVKALETLAKPDNLKRLGGGINLSLTGEAEDGQKYAIKPESGAQSADRAIEEGGYAMREAAAYSVATIVGGGIETMVPVSGAGNMDLSEYEGRELEVEEWASFQAFVPDAATHQGVGDSDEDVQRAMAFDFIMGNTDRHGGNWMVNSDGKLFLIDNNMILPDYDVGGSGDVRLGWVNYDRDLGDRIVSPAAVKPWVEAAPKVESYLKAAGFSEAVIDGYNGRLEAITASSKKGETWNDLLTSFDRNRKGGEDSDWHPSDRSDEDEDEDEGDDEDILRSQLGGGA